jgi:hypothetical protein
MRLLELAGYLLQGASSGERVGAGRIVGGWEYVYVSYGITYAAVIVYTLSLWLRRASAQRSEDFR